MNRPTLNRIRTLGAALFCGLGIALISSGCSRNIASVPDASPPATSPRVETETETAPRSARTAGSEPEEASGSEISWESDLESALAEARETQKPIMIDFYATWCGPCKLLDERIYPTADVVREAQNFITVKIDVDQQQALARRYQVSGLPTIVFLNPSGNELHRQSGIDGRVQSFVQLMQRAHSKFTPSAI